ncbi:conserved hypothetical protein [Flavobacterium sp. 9AF]|uniref:DUF6268 family outer membrane beta-barrel protein n=1 Tax=Flavobacterium sp. 9AF TaxID=2653142 RepID=UPI0012F18362|nr:DUF6268 family outer membrane beta-barrel protein [Flavobacterium sp. 9AF]VXB14701.1 conserved hypothetical protein [Flavobacterium sp. 9AF]
MNKWQFFIILLSVSKGLSQNKNSLQYTRSYDTNKEVISTISDDFQYELHFKKGYRFFSNFSTTSLHFLTELTEYNSYNIENLYSFDIGLEKSIPLNATTNLVFMVNPQIRTNDFESEISNSLLFNSSALFEKKFNSKSQLNIGISYGTLFGYSRFYPVFDFNYRFNEKLKVVIGFPKSGLFFNWSQKNELALETAYRSYFSHITNTVSRANATSVLEYQSLFFNKTTTSLSYNYNFSNTSKITLSIGKSFNNKLEINEYDIETTNYSFKNDFIISMGIKFNLNK